MVQSKALISCTIIAQLICAFVLAYMQKAGFLMTRLTYQEILSKADSSVNFSSHKSNQDLECNNFHQKLNRGLHT